MTRKGPTVTEIVHFIATELERALAQGLNQAAARQAAEAATRATFAGERPYIPALPKQQRAVQLARLQLASTRDLAVASGMNVRTVRRITRGR